MTDSITNWDGYGIKISADPVHYGDPCAREQGERIAARLKNLLTDKFPGIDVNVVRDYDTGRNPVWGPDDERIEEITQWVQEHFTDALSAADQ